MNRIKLSLLFLAFLALPLLAEPSVMYGKFIDTEFGDYAHAQVEDSKGELHSFWLGSDPKLEALVTETDDYRGKKMKIYWKKVTRDIPEAGGPMEIDEMVRFEVLD